MAVNPKPSKLAAALNYLQQIANVRGEATPDDYQQRLGLQGDATPSMSTVTQAARDFGGGVATNLGNRARDIAPVMMETVDPRALQARPATVKMLGDVASIGKAIVTDPVGTGKSIVSGEADRAKLAMNNPRSMGEYTGSFIDPLRIASALSKGNIAKRNIFIGEKAKTWDANAASKALEMEKAGIDPKEIWTETGTFRSPDGKLRQEISDKEANLQDSTYKNFRRNKEGSYTPLNKLLTHTELDNSYPVFNEQRSVRRGNDYDWNASYNGADFGLGVMPKDMMKSGLIHELQHYIQEAEGFNGGGSAKRMVVPKPTEIDVKLMDELRTAFEKLPGGSKERIAAIKIYNEVADPFDPYAQYHLLAGEAEARAAQSRRNMTALERKAKFPEESYDVPINKLLIKN